MIYISTKLNKWKQIYIPYLLVPILLHRVDVCRLILIHFLTNRISCCVDLPVLRNATVWLWLNWHRVGLDWRCCARTIWRFVCDRIRLLHEDRWVQLMDNERITRCWIGSFLAMCRLGWRVWGCRRGRLRRIGRWICRVVFLDSFWVVVVVVW